jgi:hypothetical protein
VLGVLDLDLGRHHERRAARDLLGHGLDDAGVGVPVDQRAMLFEKSTRLTPSMSMRRQPSPRSA